MEFGEDLSFLIQVAEDDRWEVSELSDSPALDFVQQFYIRSFWELKKSRQIGFNGPQPLKISEIREYLDMKGLRKQTRRMRFFEIIQSLDQLFLEDHYGD